LKLAATLRRRSGERHPSRGMLSSIFAMTKKKEKKSRCYEAADPGLGDCGVASKGPQLSEAKLGSEQCSPQRGE